MTTLLAIDGSLRCVGLALFRDARLVWTGAVSWGRRSTKIDPAARASILADEAAQMVFDQRWLDDGRVSEVVYEWPQAYNDEKDPNDLLGILAVSGEICAGHKTVGGPVASYLPRIWTAGIPKKVNGKLPKDPHTSPRAIRIHNRLNSSTEIEVFDRAKTNDEIDAVGIGLHHLGRGIAERKRVYPGAV